MGGGCEVCEDVVVCVAEEERSIHGGGNENNIFFFWFVVGKKKNQLAQLQQQANMGRMRSTSINHIKLLLFYGGGMFFFHVVSGFYQEKLFSVKGYQFGFYLTLIRYLFNTCFGFLYLQVAKYQKKRTKCFADEEAPWSVETQEESKQLQSLSKVPMRIYMLLSFLSVMAFGFSVSSLTYLNYPTKVC